MNVRRSLAAAVVVARGARAVLLRRRASAPRPTRSTTRPRASTTAAATSTCSTRSIVSGTDGSGTVIATPGQQRPDQHADTLTGWPVPAPTSVAVRSPAATPTIPAGGLLNLADRRRHLGPRRAGDARATSSRSRSPSTAAEAITSSPRGLRRRPGLPDVKVPPAPDGRARSRRRGHAGAYPRYANRFLGYHPVVARC